MENLETKAQTAINDERIKAVLFLLHSHLKDLSIQIETSYSLLNIGEKTELSKQIEKSVNNPIGNLFNISAKIDIQIKMIVHKFVVAFLQKKNNIVASAYKNLSTSNTLSYSIILKKDTLENRNLIFDFNDQYDLVEISTKFPVIFHFVPSQLEIKLKKVEKIAIQ